MFALSIVLLLSGLLTTAICLPMVYEKVPMNSYFGMRTKHTFRSNESWVHLNEIGGMLFSLLGFPLMLGGSIGFFLSEQYLAMLGTVTAVVALVSIAFAVYLFVRYSGRYTERNTQVARQN